MERIKDRSIYFCFPYRNVGGVPLLFLRMAEYLATKLENEIYVVDYIDGYMATHIKSSKVKFLEYKDEVEVIIPENGILVLQSMTPWSIFPSLRPADSCKLFFWNCHPYNLVPVFPGIRNWIYGSIGRTVFFLNSVLFLYKLRVIKFLKLLLKFNAIAFMDRANVEVTEKALGITCDIKDYLAVTLGEPVTDFRPLERNTKLLIKAAWIGRIADFKVHILIYSMQKLSQFAIRNRRSVEFTIVGSGEYLELIKATSLENDFFTMHYVNELSPSDVKFFLKENVDVLFAMGTSALEGASLGVPTVLLDVSYVPVEKDYKFQFLFEKTGCVLGDVMSKKHFCVGNQSLNNILSSLDSDYVELSKKSYGYFKMNHSINSVADKFIDCLAKDQLTFSLLKQHKVLSQTMSYRVLKYFRNCWN